MLILMSKKERRRNARAIAIATATTPPGFSVDGTQWWRRGKGNGKRPSPGVQPSDGDVEVKDRPISSLYNIPRLLGKVKEFLFSERREK
jgi:hypothetical protein